MRDLAAEIGQSCNLGTLDNDRVRIVGQVESPADFGFRVRVGALFDLAHTATGMVLAAFSDETYEGVDNDLLNEIRSNGGFILPDSAQPGITDVVVPILRSNGREAIAAITVPYIATSYSPSGVEVVREKTAHATQQVQAALGI